MTDSRGAGAQILENILSDNECMEACILDGKCIGVELIHSPGRALCGLYFSPENLMHIQVAKNVTLGIIVDRCQRG